MNLLRRDPTCILIASGDTQVLTRMREAVGLAFPGAVQHVATDAYESLRLVKTLGPDWVLLDLNLFEALGHELMADAAGKPLRRVIAIAGHSQDDRILPALRLGAAGFVVKRDSVELIASGLREIDRGEPALTQALAGQILRELDWNGLADTLSSKQLELLTWLYAGDTRYEAAGRMQLDGVELAHAVTEIWNKTIFPCPPLPVARTG